VKIIIRSPNVPMSKALEEHCQSRARRAVEPFTGQVGRVEIVMVDVNGPKKALGQVCRVFVDLTHGGQLIFVSRARDFYSAVSRATFGAGRRLARVLARARNRAQPRVRAEGAA
jgi:ribosome-associated translation inhibitor RaiA